MRGNPSHAASPTAAADKTQTCRLATEIEVTPALLVVVVVKRLGSEETQSDAAFVGRQRERYTLIVRDNICVVQFSRFNNKWGCIFKLGFISTLLPTPVALKTLPEKQMCY